MTIPQMQIINGLNLDQQEESQWLSVLILLLVQSQLDRLMMMPDIRAHACITAVLTLTHHVHHLA